MYMYQYLTSFILRCHHASIISQWVSLCGNHQRPSNLFLRAITSAVRKEDVSSTSASMSARRV